MSDEAMRVSLARGIAARLGAEGYPEVPAAVERALAAEDPLAPVERSEAEMVAAASALASAVLSLAPFLYTVLEDRKAPPRAAEIHVHLDGAAFAGLTVEERERLVRAAVAEAAARGGRG
jgi:hypothetical protein